MCSDWLCTWNTIVKYNLILLACIFHKMYFSGRIKWVLFCAPPGLWVWFYGVCPSITQNKRNSADLVHFSQFSWWPVVLCTTRSPCRCRKPNKNQWSLWFHSRWKRQPFIQSVSKPFTSPSVAVVVVELYVEMVHMLARVLQTLKEMFYNQGLLL